MTLFIRLTVAGANVGPTFSLFSDADGYTSAFATGVALSTLYPDGDYFTAPDGTTEVKIVNEGGICEDLFLTVATTTSTSTTATPTTTTSTTLAGTTTSTTTVPGTTTTTTTVEGTTTTTTTPEPTTTTTTTVGVYEYYVTARGEGCGDTTTDIAYASDGNVATVSQFYVDSALSTTYAGAASTIGYKLGGIGLPTFVADIDIDGALTNNTPCP
jgi:hypothetical protein